MAAGSGGESAGAVGMGTAPSRSTTLPVSAAGVEAQPADANRPAVSSAPINALMLISPDRGPGQQAVVLVHGGGVTRDEGGFFTRLAVELAEVDVATLRYDLRGHGESDGRPEESSLAAHLNDIRVVRDHLREASGARIVNLLGTSFGGGLVAYYAAKRPDKLTRLVLLNPQLNYRDRYIDQKPHWSGDFLDDAKAQQLVDQGYIDHSPTVKHSRAFLNEVFWIRPNEVLGEIMAPTLIVHGTKDTFVSIEASRAAVRQFRVEHGSSSRSKAHSTASRCTKIPSTGTRRASSGKPS